MAGYILVDIKTKKTVAVCSVIALVLFVIGILIGYFSGKHAPKETVVFRSGTIEDALKTTCSNLSTNKSIQTYFKRFVERHSEKTTCVDSAERCLDFGLPRHYIAYHLKDQQINIDGRMNESAWKEVPWSEKFVDMRSEVYPAPYLDTKFKMRWDQDFLYIGAQLQETNLWATYEDHDSSIWKENGFEMLMDVDGTMFNYKQIQINVLGTMMDQLLYMSPYDKSKAWEITWDANAKRAVQVTGTVNTPGDTDSSWSVEIAIPFKTLAAKSERVHDRPLTNETWFIQFGRSEQKLRVQNGKTYERIPNSTTDWWSWQPCDAINLHLQDRWGLVQFKTDTNDRKFSFQKWHIYKSLFDSMDALKKYKALNGKYTNQLEELDLPPYLLAGTCVNIPDVKLVRRNNQTDFDVTITSKFISHAPAHIRSDRYVSFSN